MTRCGSATGRRGVSQVPGERMIICNSCGNQMENDLRFCAECGAENPTVDATTLVRPRVDAARRPALATPTVRQGEQQSEGTSAQSHSAHPPYGFPSVNAISPGSYLEAPSPQKRSPVMVIGLIAGAAVLLLVGGIASRLLFDNNHKDNSLATTQTQVPATTNDLTPPTGQGAAQTQSQPLPRSTEPPLAQPTQPPLLDNRASKREIEETLNGWAGAAGGHDLDGQMSYYADSLDTYFRRRNVSAGYVRKTKEAAFTRYTTMDVQLGPITVEIDPSGTLATATFDKTYRFEGDGVLSGSVRQEVSLTNISGRWRITGERDTHVYYTNK